MTDEAIRWTVIVSRDTDVAVRTHLAQRGMKKGDLSRFIEDAVRRRVFEQTVADVKARYRDVDPATLEEDIENALRDARAERFGDPPPRQ
jgi:hypothetical protein